MKTAFNRMLTSLAVIGSLVSSVASAQYVQRVDGLFSKIYAIQSNSRTPLYETPDWEVSPTAIGVTKVRVRNPEACARSGIGRWNFDAVTLNQSMTFRSPQWGSDALGSYVDFNLSGSADVDTIKFHFSSLDAGATPCWGPSVELWASQPAAAAVTYYDEPYVTYEYPEEVIVYP